MTEAAVLFRLVRRHNAYGAGRLDLAASNASVSSYAEGARLRGQAIAREATEAVQ
jgi:hypothetical protein